MSHALGASLLFATGLLAASQGCALFTCIEDCDSVSSSSGGAGVGGTGGPTATGSTTDADATSTGTGGAGGSAPCTDCPICSDELDGPALSVAVLADKAYALVQGPGPASVFELAIVPDGFGDAVPLPVSLLARGRLVATSESVLHVTENLFQDVLSGKGCDTSSSIIGAAAADTQPYFLFPDGLRTFNDCFETSPDVDFAGAASIAASPGRIAFHGDGVGPCVKELPLVVSNPAVCLAGEKPLAVALNPSGKRILFRDATKVHSWGADPSEPAQSVADFEGAEEAGLPMDATMTEVFFARSNPTETMWRCKIDPPYECRSAETEAVSSIHVDDPSNMAYFTMGSRVCRWP